MTSAYVFIILLSSSVFFQLINSESTILLTSTISILNDTKTTIRRNETDQISESTTSESILSLNLTSINESTTSIIDSNRPSILSSKLSWWLLIAPLLTVVVVLSIGIIYYYQRQSPYRRFLQNWRSHDDDTDNIILQLEQPEILNGQWPPRISFA